MCMLVHVCLGVCLCVVHVSMYARVRACVMGACACACTSMPGRVHHVCLRVGVCLHGRLDGRRWREGRNRWQLLPPPQLQKQRFIR